MSLDRPDRVIGRSVPRVEDARLLTGEARYVADLTAPGLAVAAFLRSSRAHALVRRVDVARAKALPGVLAVFTAADLAPMLAPVHFDGAITGMRRLVHSALADDRVRLVGDPLVLVVAEDRYLAEDAIELIDVEYEGLPAVADVATALAVDAPTLYDEAPGNIAYHDAVSFGDVDSAFARADRVVTRTLVQHRCAPAPLETRGGLAVFDPADGMLTYHAAVHAPHLMRMILSQHLHLPQHRIRVLVPEVGGSFGSKWGVTREDLLVCAAAIRIGRPVRWIEDRAEGLATGGHAREETMVLQVAVRGDGAIQGMKADLVMDVGAYPVIPMNPAFFTLALRLLLPGPYRVPAYRFEVTTVLTNKGPYVAYRGPWAVETWARETMMDVLGQELGLDPVEIRRRNLVSRDEQPLRTAAGYTLEGIRARETLDRALEIADLPSFRTRQRAARDEGRELLGFGLATFLEPAPGGAEFLAMSGGARENVRIRMEPDARVTVMTSQVPHGQGHETTLAQVVADELGLPLGHVRVLHSDTDATPFSLSGTGGSRSAALAGGACRLACRDLAVKLTEIASVLLGTPASDLEVAEGTVRVRSRPRSCVGFERIAGMVYLAPGFLPAGVAAELVGGATFDGGRGGFSQATHCCWVRVDRATGLVRVARYLVVGECGTMINPAVVEGQIVGGTVQGIGAVLLEQVRYDRAGRLLTRSLGDYGIPTAADLPRFEIEHLRADDGQEDTGFRGVAEGGAICAPPAVTNAVADALGVEVTRQAVSAEGVLGVLRDLARGPGDTGGSAAGIVDR